MARQPCPQICKLLADSSSSEHAAVAQRALQLWRSGQAAVGRSSPVAVTCGPQCRRAPAPSLGKPVCPRTARGPGPTQERVVWCLCLSVCMVCGVGWGWVVCAVRAVGLSRARLG